MAKKRANGEGNIRKRADGRCGVVPCKYSRKIPKNLLN